MSVTDQNHVCKNQINEYISSLLEKSIEAYLMSLEIVNKPTISYRTEGFCFYISNAWELLLKAFIIEQKQDINSIIIEPSKNKRSLTLSDCINRVFSSPENTTRNNLTRVVTIRNTATHLIVPTLDYDLAPLFQKTVSDYYDFIKNKFDYKILPSMRPFISLNYSNSPQEDNSLKLFPDIESVLNNLTKHDDATEMRYTLTLVRRGHADFTAVLEKESQVKFHIINTPTDAEKTHPYTQKEILKMVKDSIECNGIDSKTFTSSALQKAIKLLKIKENSDYSYHHNNKSYNYFTYSEATIGFLTEKFLDPTFRERIVAKSIKKTDSPK